MGPLKNYFRQLVAHVWLFPDNQAQKAGDSASTGARWCLAVVFVQPTHASETGTETTDEQTPNILIDRAP